MKLNVRAFALSAAVLWAAAAFVLALTAQWFDWGDQWVAALSDIYIGYAPGFVGGVAGAVWAFVDALVGCSLFAWLYNKMLEKK